MKIASIVGARPQFIKLAAVSDEIRKYHKEIIIHTGQHYDDTLSARFFTELKIAQPDYNLGIGSGSHGHQTGRMIMAIEDTLKEVGPDFVLVFGDTNSTFSGAIAAAKLKIPVGHVECGLRTFDKSIAEEINRIVTEKVSTLLFAPTELARQNLLREGYRDNVYLTGDVMKDSLLRFHKIAMAGSRILHKLGLAEHDYIVATIHHPENTDNLDRLLGIFDALGKAEKTVVFPAHPRTIKMLGKKAASLKGKKNIVMTGPLGYLDFLSLLSSSAKVVTDSGGIQKEAYLLGVPCVTVYATTEWQETIEDGWNVLADPDKPADIVAAIKRRGQPRKGRNPYGDGHAARKIARIINRYLAAHAGRGGSVT